MVGFGEYHQTSFIEIEILRFQLTAMRVLLFHDSMPCESR
jgi:hypothetical protein